MQEEDLEEDMESESKMIKVITKRAKTGWRVNLSQRAEENKKYLNGGDLIRFYHMES